MSQTRRAIFVSPTAFKQTDAIHKTDVIDDLIDQFERRWQAGKPPGIGEFLDLPEIRNVPDSERRSFIVELIMVDLEFRWRDERVSLDNALAVKGTSDALPRTRPMMEDYLRAHPELASEDGMLGKLLEEEFRVRQRHGDELSIEDYVSRFPQLEKWLRHKLPTLATNLQRAHESSLLTREVSSSLRDFRIPLTTNVAAGQRDSVGASSGSTTPSVWTLRNARVNLLSVAKPFCNFSSSLINSLSEQMSEREFKPDEWLCREGDVGEAIFIISEGEVSIIAGDGRGGVRVIDRKQKGDVLGIFPLVTGLPHLASAQAMTVVKTLCFPAASFADTAARSPIVASILAEQICRNTSKKAIDSFCGKFVQGYRIRRQIARGTMSIIYKAEASNGKTVALKMMKHHLALDHEAKMRFRREAEILTALKHPNIVKFYETIDAFGTSFHVLEHCGSATLAEAILKDAPFSEERARHVIGQLANALSYAHGMGVVHRDLKPSNILLREDGSVLLIDFGLSRSALSVELTEWGEILGTPGYMPPEQLVGTPVTKAADLYALGCVTFEMLTGRPLFESADEMDLLHEKLRLPPKVKRLSGHVSHSMYSFLCGSLAANSDDRVLKLESISDW